jgi:hypothetical protein
MFYKKVDPKGFYAISANRTAVYIRKEEAKNPMVKTEGSFSVEDMKNVQINIGAVKPIQNHVCASRRYLYPLHIWSM